MLGIKSADLGRRKLWFFCRFRNPRCISTQTGSTSSGSGRNPGRPSQSRALSGDRGEREDKKEKTQKLFCHSAVQPAREQNQ